MHLVTGKMKGKKGILQIFISIQKAVSGHPPSEDTGEMGPFFSVIYKIGEVDTSNKERPFNIYTDFSKWASVSGFKIEALSGPSKNINCTHSFGTEDEVFGGIWRAISIE